MIENATAASFSPYLGEKFCVRAGAVAPLELELVEVSAAGSGATQAAAARGGRAPFSIVFRGPVHPSLSQGTYALEHTALGSFDIFLVPIALDARGLCYEAVFN